MNLIGKEVTIKNKDHFEYGGWGIVKDYDGEYYYVAMYNGDTELVFTRDEIKVRRAGK